MSRRLPALPSVRELIKLYGLSARSELSQNFLLDQKITEKIARSADVAGCTVIEVGAGPGPLTRSLLAVGASKVIAVEKDKRFKDALNTVAESEAANDRLRVVLGDMFDVDEGELLREAGVPPTDWNSPSSVRLVGNLPFNVGTQLMLKWLRQVHDRTGLFSAFGRVPFTLLLQKEVAQRIVAKPNTSQYSRLSIAVQQSCSAKMLFDIRGGVFVPQAAVDTSVVQIIPNERSLLPKEVPVMALEQMCGSVFGRRRKMLRTAVKALGPQGEAILAASECDPTLRPEAVSVEQWCKMAVEYYKLGLYHPFEKRPREKESDEESDSE